MSAISAHRVFRLVQEAGGTSWYAWWLWGAVGVGLLLAWFGLARRLLRAIPRRRHSQQIAQFASRHGWRYSRRRWLDVGLGAPFVLGETTPCTNIVTGEVVGQPFTAFEYAHELQAFMIDLQGDLPFLEVRSRTMVDAASPDKMPIILESEDFNRRFRVVADDHRYATAVLHPQLMTRLLSGPDLSWRILGNRLVSWREGILDPALIAPAVEMVNAIEQAIPSFVWDDYAAPSGR